MAFPQLRSRGPFAAATPGNVLTSAGTASCGFVGVGLMLGVLVAPSFGQTSFVSSPEGALFAAGDSLAWFVSGPSEGGTLSSSGVGTLNFVSVPVGDGKLNSAGSSFAMFVAAPIKGSVLEASGRTVATAFASVPTQPGALEAFGHGEAAFVGIAKVGSELSGGGTGSASFVGVPTGGGVLAAAGVAPQVTFTADIVAAGVLVSSGTSPTYFLGPGGVLPGPDRRGSPMKGRTRMRGRRITTT